MGPRGAIGARKQPGGMETLRANCNLEGWLGQEATNCRIKYINSIRKEIEDKLEGGFLPYKPMYTQEWSSILLKSVYHKQGYEEGLDRFFSML